HTRAALDDVQRADVTHRPLALPRRGAERAEVVSASQHAEPGTHRAEIERDRDVPGVAPQERTGDRAVVDQVRVPFPRRVAAGVEPGGGGADLPHADVSG